VSKDTDTQPSATINPATATHGVAQTFTATVTAPAGLAYINWTFGDGTATVQTSGASATHTYATAGTKTLTAIVTDNHGNEKKVVKTITVS
jgi:PKD repeat protein